MGLFGQLKFALLCLEFLARPVIALGFPLIPFWSSMKLMVRFWLVFPRFHGACYAYKHFIRPFLVLNLQEAIARFEEKNLAKSKDSSFIDVADKFIKDNGFDALEKLIAAKKKFEDPYNTMRDIGLSESGEESEASTLLKPLNEHVAALKNNSSKMLEVVETSTAEVKVPPKIKSIIFPHKWKCSLCKVETSSERNLSDHLRGSKHKAMCDCESLKSSKLSLDIRTKVLLGISALHVTWSWMAGKRHASNVAENGLS